MSHIEMPCPDCGAVNRLPQARLGDSPRCGRCRRGLLPSTPVDTDVRRFHAEVEQAPIPVLVDFWAPWCGPCRMVAPALSAIAAERRGQIKIVKVNVDESPQLAVRFSAQSIPMLALFRGGRVVDTVLGAQPKRTLDAWLDQRLR